MPTFDRLPFNNRPDLSPFLIHFTKSTEVEDSYTAFDNLCKILQEGTIWGSKGFVKGPNKAVCFMDIPFLSLKYIFTEDNQHQYEPYGVLVHKVNAYSKGARPVLYLSDEETDQLRIPKDELWRVVRLEKDKKGNWISWLHEREWRKKGDFQFTRASLVALVKTSKEANELGKRIEAENYKCGPIIVIPLNIVCQGLTL